VGSRLVAPKEKADISAGQGILYAFGGYAVRVLIASASLAHLAGAESSFAGSTPSALPQACTKVPRPERELSEEAVAALELAMREYDPSG
jgi:hypothetical protein